MLHKLGVGFLQIRCLLVEFCLSTRMYVVTRGADEADSWGCGILTSCQEVPWEERGVGVCAMCTSLSLVPMHN